MPDPVFQNKILLIAASETLRERLCHLLQPVGQIQIATSDQQAIAQASNLHPNLLLLQLRCSDIAGKEVCQQLRRDARTLLLPIVLIGENDTIQDVIAGLDAGADDYLRLTRYAPADLRKRIRSHLAREARLFHQMIKKVD